MSLWTLPIVRRENIKNIKKIKITTFRKLVLLPFSGECGVGGRREEQLLHTIVKTLYNLCSICQLILKASFVLRYHNTFASVIES
jgi:hypothetical protein